MSGSGIITDLQYNMPDTVSGAFFHFSIYLLSILCVVEYTVRILYPYRRANR